MNVITVNSYRAARSISLAGINRIALDIRSRSICILPADFISYNMVSISIENGNTHVIKIMNPVLINRIVLSAVLRDGIITGYNNSVSWSG